MKQTWVIDVCKTCGRLAQWPFCEHRQSWIEAGMTHPGWYTAVTVTGNWADPPYPEPTQESIDRIVSAWPTTPPDAGRRPDSFDAEGNRVICIICDAPLDADGECTAECDHGDEEQARKLLDAEAMPELRLPGPVTE